MQKNFSLPTREQYLWELKERTAERLSGAVPHCSGASQPVPGWVGAGDAKLLWAHLSQDCSHHGRP